MGLEGQIRLRFRMKKKLVGDLKQEDKNRKSNKIIYFAKKN